MRKKEKTGKRMLALIATLALCGCVLGGCGNAGNASSGTETEATGTNGSTAEDIFNFTAVSDVTFPLKEKLSMCLNTVFLRSAICICDKHRRR